MSDVDAHRTVGARMVEDVDTEGVGPGSVEVRAFDGAVWGYGYACAGCGSRSYLALSDDNPGPRWDVTAGDPRKPETVTLSPSIFHTKERGGCGWHGYLAAGVFRPC